MKNLYVRLYYDLKDIKKTSIWKMALTDSDSHILYIETLHDKVSSDLPESEYVKLTQKSYFKGLAAADANLATLELVNQIDNTGSTNINIFVNEDEEIRNKINRYLDKYFNKSEDKNLNLIFKDSFEEILFLNFMGEDFFKDYTVRTANITNIFCDPDKRYEIICDESVKKSLEDLKDNEEIKSLFSYITIVVEDLILKDLFTYINK